MNETIDGHTLFLLLVIGLALVAVCCPGRGR